MRIKQTSTWPYFLGCLFLPLCKIFRLFLNDTLSLCLHINGSRRAAFMAQNRLCDIDWHSVGHGQCAESMPQRMRRSFGKGGKVIDTKGLVNRMIESQTFDQALKQFIRPSVV